jgi:hypothetical protein
MTAIAAGAPSRTARGSIYTWTALACVATAFLGYIPTYWQPLAAGAMKANPIVHIHGALFFTWTLYAAAQTSLVGSRQVALHRSVGLAGISLATALVAVGLLAALNSLKSGIAANQAAGAEAFLIVPLSVITGFAIIFVAAIANIRRPEVHKRLMLLATVSIMNAPVARPLIVYIFKYPPSDQLPVSIDLPSFLVSFVLLIPAMIYDWRTRGRPHPIYLVGGPALALLSWAVDPISTTAAWHAFAHAYAGLAGAPLTSPA